MFEVVISSVNTGYVRRKLFPTREAADRHVEQFFHGGRRPRSPRDYRVEVYQRPLPELRALPAAPRAELNPAA